MHLELAADSRDTAGLSGEGASEKRRGARTQRRPRPPTRRKTVRSEGACGGQLPGCWRTRCMSGESSPWAGCVKDACDGRSCSCPRSEGRARWDACGRGRADDWGCWCRRGTEDEDGFTEAAAVERPGFGAEEGPIPLRQAFRLVRSTLPPSTLLGLGSRTLAREPLSPSRSPSSRHAAILPVSRAGRARRQI